MNASFFAANRRRLLERVGHGALVVLTAYSEMQRGHDAASFFEQEACFWYLSGIDHPDWWLIIDGKTHRTYAVSPDLSATKQIFDGSLAPEDAREISGIDEVISRDEADSLLRRLRREHPLVYTVNEAPYLKQYVSFTLNPAQKDLHDYLTNRFQSVRNCLNDVLSLRAIKQEPEVAAIQNAIDISIAGFRTLKRELTGYKYEYEAEARLSYDFRRVGAAGHAYSPIVADGHNACTLHYVANETKLTKKSLLLIDAGAKYDHYAADITRTYAVGMPTKRMSAVHAAVLEVQHACIAACCPGLSLGEFQAIAERETARVLETLGLAHDPEAVGHYFPHAIGHGLGLDVHDGFGQYDSLQPGMVVTVEPGIYIPEESIGVRIEDDILITDDGRRNLSRALSTDL